MARQAVGTRSADGQHYFSKLLVQTPPGNGKVFKIDTIVRDYYATISTREFEMGFVTPANVAGVLCSQAVMTMRRQEGG
jgi:hypothetical protein